MNSITPTCSSLSGTASSSYNAPAVDADDLHAEDDPHLDLEGDIQSQRIANILDKAVYKTKLAICLPILVREKETLSRIMKPQDIKELFRFCKDINDTRISSLINYEAVESIESGNTNLRHRLCPNMAHFLCMLSRYESLNSKVEEVIEKIREDDYRGKAVPLGFAYLVQLERLRNLTLEQTSKSAAEVLQAVITEKRQEGENRKLVERIQEVSAILSEEKKGFEESMARKHREISLLQKELIKSGQIANTKRKQTVSNFEMSRLTNMHNAKSAVLNEMEAETREVYDRILKGNVSEESTLRARRRKVEGQLSAFIAKYDADMMEKQKELDEINNLYDEEAKFCKDLKLKLAKQNKEFEPLMSEREEEYHAEMTEKMNRFIVDHAARVIQNAWLQVGVNRDEKKRLRKILKKRQDAKKNAEKRAKAEEAAVKKAAKDGKKSTTTSEGA